MHHLSALPPTASFASRLALDLLKHVAAHTDESSFVLLFRPMVGRHCTLKAFLAFREDLKHDRIAPPAYTLVSDQQQAAVYNPDTRCIDVSEARIESALQTSKASFDLLTGLLEAFAGYVEDSLSRRPDALQTSDAPSPLDQGAAVAFAKALLFYAEPVKPGDALATYRPKAEAASVTISLGTLELPESRRRRTKRFAAGHGEAHVPGSSGHGSLSRLLVEVGFSTAQCDAIYFGNWLRDHSQLIDQKLVRPADMSALSPETREQIGKASLRFSRERLTTLVDLLALKAFAPLQTTPDSRAAYKVTPDRLGVYRPHEHIDNPLVPTPQAYDPRQIDPDFLPLVLPGDPRLGLLPKRSIKRYIRRSIAYMQAKLSAAKKEGPTPVGLRYLGEALHVLEDYFAHSNVVELCLKRAVDDRVLVWTPKLEKVAPSGHAWPVVTGMFGQLDLINSLLDPLANHFFPTDLDESQSEDEQAVFDQIVTTILEEEGLPLLLRLYGLYVQARRQIASNYYYKIYNATASALQHHFKPLNYAGNFFMKPLVKWAGDHIATLQVLLHKDPNTDPEALLTHSQLAKDHATHPFHTLAVQLAGVAVKQVGQAMYAHWAGHTEQADSPIDIAKGFLVHPWDVTWWEATVVQWAQDNPRKVAQGTSIETLRTLQFSELGHLSDRLSKVLKETGEFIQEIEDATGASWIQTTFAPDFIPL